MGRRTRKEADELAKIKTLVLRQNIVGLMRIRWEIRVERIWISTMGAVWKDWSKITAWEGELV